MERRRILKGSAIAAALALTGGTVYLRSSTPAQILTVDAALRKIDALADRRVSSSGTWNPHQIFSHCAQSIEYSMSGYPEPKSRLFMDTAGTLAFSVFSARKKMMHNLGEPIAGAPVLHADADSAAGLARLRQAFLAFQQFNGTLAPHFAYGALSKDEYALAHALHFSNHLEQITIAA
jgi:hypothetical protein